MAEIKKFGSKIGLIAATVGSAVGLGNIWRFPAETQANGGAAFLLVYILCVLILGIPVMLAEFALGRGGQSDAIGVFKRFVPKSAWWGAGALSILASYLICCFYMVVAGWTLEYLMQSISGHLYDVTSAAGGHAMEASFHEHMEQYICGVEGPLICTYAMIAINIAILLGGVRKGIEKISNILMPILFLLLVAFAIVSCTMSGAAEGLSFFLSPDFSKITPEVIVSALGQAFFSLSLGMGILITYSAYYPHETNLTSTAITVSLLDLLVAVLMGFIIFPAITSFNLQGADIRGTTLVFVTLPEVFAHMGMTQLWSILFFFSLLVAALTSTISISEVSIRFVQDRFKKGRFAATMIVMLPLFIFSGVCTLSFGPLSDVKLFDMNIFDLLDTVTNNYMLPIVSILVCLFMGWFAPKTLLKDQLTNHGSLKVRLYPAVRFILRYIAPILIIFVLLSAFL
ncbi:MAG: sodium-dependent transporter [Muribaculaceae bacterium]|nr:sodium-dependent transporter [Muribaculaceae bacterium]